MQHNLQSSSIYTLLLYPNLEFSFLYLIDGKCFIFYLVSFGYLSQSFNKETFGNMETHVGL